MNKNKYVTGYHYTSRLQPMVTNQVGIGISLLCMNDLCKYEHVVSFVIHVRGIREVHVKGTGYAPQGRPARN